MNGYLKFNLIFGIAAIGCGCWSIQSATAPKIFAERSIYKRQTNTSDCSSTKFRCLRGACIDKNLLCNGVRDCIEGDDENFQQCKDNSKCGSTKFRCKSGACIDKSRLCNGFRDCNEEEDESYEQCKDNVCGDTKFRCKSGACIEKHWLCNGFRDCINGEDESFEHCKNNVCSNTKFRCKSGACIEKHWLCNGFKDCIDADDESFEQCKDNVCSITKFRCKSGACIEKHWLCNGFKDCIDGEDESFEHCKNNVCSSTKFRCKSGACIEKHWLCNGVPDCIDGEDESSENCMARDCGSTRFQCKNGQCIDKSWICDGYKNCIDGSDETFELCKDHSCISTKFHCKSGQCMDKSWLCDGYKNCVDGSDETFELCKNNPCNSSKFHCKSGQCIDKSWLCDGYNNCVEGSDETFELCKDYSCSSTKFHCKSGQCIEKSWVCDGHKNCIDGSDETSELCKDHSSTIGAPDLNSCILPPATPDKTYTISCPNKDKGCGTKPGDIVPEFTPIISRCNRGYAKYQDGQISDTGFLSTCLSRSWLPEVVKCKKICSDVSSLDLNLSCFQYLNGPILPCAGVLLEGAVVVPTCKPQHRISSKVNYSHVTCQNDGTWDKEFFKCSPDTDEGMTMSISKELSGNETSNAKFCTLPPPTADKSYTVKCPEGHKTCVTKSGGKVKEFTQIRLRCGDGYTRKEGVNFSSVCLDGGWISPIVKCSKICNALPSHGLDFTCSQSRKDAPKACPATLTEGNVVYPRCKEHFHPDRGLDYRDRFMICQTDGTWDREFFKCSPDCGKTNSSSINLIAHGQREKPGEAPWNVAIYSTVNSKNPNFICGGTLISVQLVLSAAHCFYDPVRHKIYNESFFVAAVGKYSRDFETTDLNSVKKYEVKKIFVPDEYLGVQTNFAADLAILKLSDRITLSEHILPACIYWSDFTPFKPAGVTIGKLSGFGSTENGTLSSQLLTANLAYISYRNCLKKLDWDSKDSISHDKFCAGYNNGTGARTGDSGGGLLFLDNGQKLYYLRGVVSHQVESLTSIAAFTDVAQYLTWIKVVVQDVNDSELKDDTRLDYKSKK